VLGAGALDAADAGAVDGAATDEATEGAVVAPAEQAAKSRATAAPRLASRNVERSVRNAVLHLLQFGGPGIR
jgi:hypothetical protein